MKITTQASAHEKLLRRFRKYLLSTQGLAARTCMARLFYVREFLQTHFKSGRRKINLQKLTPEVLLDYVLERSTRDSAGRLQALASALRAFGDFCNSVGVVATS